MLQLFYFNNHINLISQKQYCLHDITAVESYFRELKLFFQKIEFVRLFKDN